MWCRWPSRRSATAVAIPNPASALCPGSAGSNHPAQRRVIPRWRRAVGDAVVRQTHDRRGHVMTLAPFHLAIPVDDIEAAREFYGGTMGLDRGRSDTKWTDWNFDGHQLVTHEVPHTRRPVPTNPVDGHDVPVPHFGLVPPSSGSTNSPSGSARRVPSSSSSPTSGSRVNRASSGACSSPTVRKRVGIQGVRRHRPAVRHLGAWRPSAPSVHPDRQNRDRCDLYAHSAPRTQPSHAPSGTTASTPDTSACG